MPDFFHADTRCYRERLKSLSIIVLVPLLTACVFCVVNIVLSFRTDNTSFITLLLIIITCCVFTGMVFEFSAAYLTLKLIQRHSRYTYFDILPSGMIYSLYAGEAVSLGERCIFRRLYYIPFSGVEEITRDPKTDPGAMRIKGEIHMFCLPSDCLGYHIDEDGEMYFDHRELMQRGFEQLNVLDIKSRFGCTKKLHRCVSHYLEEFKNRPEKKPFDISDYVKVKKKKHLKTSNPLLEAPSFDRKWQR